jgi:hypothetical protein
MSGHLILGIGVVLMIAGFFLAHWYHVKVLKEPYWEGVTGSSQADRIAARLDNLGISLIVIGLLVGLARHLGRL